ncbi:MAG: chemotaxis protein CheW [Kofleriaceae bacterium]
MTSESYASYLLCQLGTRVCAIPIAHIAETMRPLPIEPIDGSPSFVLGVSVIRGTPTPVVDTRVLVGLPPAPSTRFVTIKTGGRTAALAVDAVLTMRSLSQAALGPVPGILGEATAAVTQAIGALDADLLFVLDATRMVPTSVWDVIAGDRGPK